MKAVIRLFKAIPIRKKNTEAVREDINLSLLQQTIKHGFILSPEIVSNYSTSELHNIINLIIEEVGLNARQMNASFHKSWQKVATADITQLVLEQIFHYITTYGFKKLGIYDKDTVFIPSEPLAIPNLDIDGFPLTIIKGYTDIELKEKLLSLLDSGISLHEDTVKDVTEIAKYLDLTEEIHDIKNKEVKITLYDHLNIIPETPVEFLRLLLFKSINKTLLIKNSTTITNIKSKDNLDVLELIKKYNNIYGLERLAEIFYRFKPLFLAFRTSPELKTYINKIRKLAKTYHKPMKSDFLNQITAKLSRGEYIDHTKLQEALNNVNTFRKIRLAYAINYRTINPHSILYRIRNGKSYATKFTPKETNGAHFTLNTIINSIIEDILPKVEGKQIYIPENMVYALPSTEKQFSCDFPSGTYISIPNNMIIGIHWENVKDNEMIDLDLSLISLNKKFGWDGNYRDEDNNILFSGDMTDAQLPDGASELFYVKNQENEAYVIFTDYFNIKETNQIDVPFDIFIAQEHATDESFRENYMVNPNNIICSIKSKINQSQKMLGLLVTTPKECRFYFSESYIGQSITSSSSEYTAHAQNFLFNFYTNTINLNDILEQAGAKIVTDKTICDVDLSPETLEKDKILSFFY